MAEHVCDLLVQIPEEKVLPLAITTCVSRDQADCCRRHAPCRRLITDIDPSHELMGLGSLQQGLD